MCLLSVYQWNIFRKKIVCKLSYCSFYNGIYNVKLFLFNSCKMLFFLIVFLFTVMFGTKSEAKSGSTKSKETPETGPDEPTEVVQTTPDPNGPIIIAFIENKAVWILEYNVIYLYIDPTFSNIWPAKKEHWLFEIDFFI